jgi:hypothetical protein
MFCGWGKVMLIPPAPPNRSKASHHTPTYNTTHTNPNLLLLRSTTYLVHPSHPAMPSTTQTLRFSSVEGGEPVAEKGPARSTTDLERMAAMLDPFGESGGLKLGKGATAHLLSHDGVKLASARADKVLGYLATFIDVDTSDLRDALTFGGHDPSAALIKVAFVLALELADEGEVPETVPASILVGFDPSLPPPTSTPSPTTSGAQTSRMEMEKLRAARATLVEAGFDLAEAAQSRLAELEAELKTTDEGPDELVTAEPATGGLGGLGVTTESLPDDAVAQLRKEMDARFNTLQELLSDVARTSTQEWPHSGAKSGGGTDTAQRDATIAARAAVMAAEAERDHFMSVNVDVPESTRARLEAATLRLSEAKATRRAGTRTRSSGEDGPGSEWAALYARYEAEANRPKRKFDGSVQLHRDVLDAVGSSRVVPMADFSILSGWSSTTRRKLAQGTFIEFPKLFKELQEGTRAVRTRVRVDDGQLVVDDGDGSTVTGSDKFTPMEHQAHARVFNAWLRLLQQIHTCNSAVLRQLRRLEDRVMDYAQSYPGFGYQRYLRIVRQRISRAADFSDSSGTRVDLSFGDNDSDLFLKVFGSSWTSGVAATAPGGATAHPDKKRGADVSGFSAAPSSICFSYDRRGVCARETEGTLCRFSHVCSACGGDHPKTACKSAVGKSPK